MILQWLTVAESVGRLQSIFGVALLVQTFYVVSLRVSFTVLAIGRARCNSNIVTMEAILHYTDISIYKRSHAYTAICMLTRTHKRTHILLFLYYIDIPYTHNKLGHEVLN